MVAKNLFPKDPHPPQKKKDHAFFWVFSCYFYTTAPLMNDGYFKLFFLNFLKNTENQREQFHNKNAERRASAEIKRP